MTATPPPTVYAQTVDISDVVGADVDLLSLIPADIPGESISAWLREDHGLVGWGRCLEFRGTGPDRFAEAETWWKNIVARADVSDAVRVFGSGLVTFGTFSFADDSEHESVLVVPEVIVGRRDGAVWRTDIGLTVRDAEIKRADLAPHQWSPQSGEVQFTDGSITAQGWPEVVAKAVSRIQSGDVEKVVLARDIVAQAEHDIDVRTLVGRLNSRYAATWTFAVDGIVGATPEMLVRLRDAQARSRVLAGTVRRDSHPGPSRPEAHPELEGHHSTDPRLRLISSDKDLEEHEYAVRSVAEALGPHCTHLDVPTEPFVLELPDVYHLASDLIGDAVTGATSLRLAAALHPSAAVCGTPRNIAAELITELEEMDRGRYAGPVGWMDTNGDGDWGIALRCGEFCENRTKIRLFAGGGIVAASDPDAELAETEIKFAAMRHALGTP